MSEGGKRYSYKECAKRAYKYYEQHGLVGGLCNLWHGLVAKPERLTALSTFAIFLATAVGIAVALATYNILSGQLAVLQGQLDAMEADQRPWIETVSIDKIGDLVFDESGANLLVQFGLANRGKSPATHIAFITDIYPETPQRNDPLIEQKKTCSDGTIFLSIGAIYPGSEVSRDNNVPLAIPRKNMEKAASPQNTISVVIVGCVQYQLAFRNTKKTSVAGFIYRVIYTPEGPKKLGTRAIPLLKGGERITGDHFGFQTVPQGFSVTP